MSTVLVVAIVLLFIIPALLPPPGIRPKAKEAEVKQNCHAIQLALERYAVDHGGNYPPFLYGGSAQFNIGTVNYYNPSPRTLPLYWSRPLHVPFDSFWNSGDGWDYSDTTWAQLLPSAGHERQRAENIAGNGTPTIDAPWFGDALALEGYMPRYPKNPFQVGRKALRYSYEELNRADVGRLRGPNACYGGEDGIQMWDISMGFGELPQLEDGSQTKGRPYLAFPGNFYYHPRWSDGVSQSGHNKAQRARNPGSWIPGDLDPALAPPLDDSAEVVSDDVAGYDLLAVGSPKTRGQDMDNAVPCAVSQTYFRSGYLTLGQEHNPWVKSSDYPQVADYSERPFSDGISDFIIIHLENDRGKKPVKEKAASGPAGS